MGRMRDTWDNRTKQQQEKKYKEQLEKMASSERWTLADFNAELKESLGSWRNKVPGMSSLKQVQVAKQTQKAVESVMEQLGPTATSQDLENLGRQEKVSSVCMKRDMYRASFTPISPGHTLLLDED